MTGTVSVDWLILAFLRREDGCSLNLTIQEVFGASLSIHLSALAPSPILWTPTGHIAASLRAISSESLGPGRPGL